MRNRAALIEVIGGYMAAHALGLAAELKIADHIHAGVTTSDELATATGTHEPSLRRMLRLLASVGITTEPAPGRFGLTEVGEQLRSDSPDSLYAFTRMFCHESHFSAWQGLAHSVRTGQSAWDHVFGKNIYAYLADLPELSELFNVAMSQESRIAAGHIAAAYDFSDVGHGGGHRRRRRDAGVGDPAREPRPARGRVRQPERRGTGGGRARRGGPRRPRRGRRG